MVLWNSLYIDAAVKKLAADGFPVTEDMLARLSPLQFEHINFLGRYAFARLDQTGLRPLRDPDAATPDAATQTPATGRRQMPELWRDRLRRRKVAVEVKSRAANDKLKELVTDLLLGGVGPPATVAAGRGPGPALGGPADRLRYGRSSCRDGRRADRMMRSSQEWCWCWPSPPPNGDAVENETERWNSMSLSNPYEHGTEPEVGASGRTRPASPTRLMTVGTLTLGLAAASAGLSPSAFAGDGGASRNGNSAGSAGAGGSSGDRSGGGSTGRGSADGASVGVTDARTTADIDSMAGPSRGGFGAAGTVPGDASYRSGSDSLGGYDTGDIDGDGDLGESVQGILDRRGVPGGVVADVSDIDADGDLGESVVGVLDRDGYSTLGGYLNSKDAMQQAGWRERAAAALGLGFSVLNNLTGNVPAPGQLTGPGLDQRATVEERVEKNQKANRRGSRGGADGLVHGVDRPGDEDDGINDVDLDHGLDDPGDPDD